MSLPPLALWQVAFDLSPLVVLTALVLLALHLVAIGSLLLAERRQPMATWAWLLVLAFLPGIGLLLYLLLGRFRARRISKRAIELSARLKRIFERAGVGGTLHGAAAREPRTESLLRLGSRLASSEASGGNATRILVDARATYDAMIAAIDAARHHVHVEFYVIQDDETGTDLREHLARKAREGVEVRVLCDGFGSFSLPSDFWDPLRDAGGEAAVFRPVRGFLRVPGRSRIEFRNHRKIVVADGRVGFTGGINIGREYLGLDPSMGSWRDTHVEIAGPAVLGLQAAFAEDWLSATDELLDDELYFPAPEDGLQGESIVQVIDSGPDHPWSPIETFIDYAFALARERIWITNPYFVPSASVEAALISAALRGVDVRLLLPQRTDSLIINLAAGSHYGQLLAAGVRIFRYERGFLHAKTIVVDDWLGTVGSANMDMRSFFLNFELNAFVLGADFARELAAQFSTDCEGAREVQPEQEQHVRLGKRLLRATARLLSPLL